MRALTRYMRDELLVFVSSECATIHNIQRCLHSAQVPRRYDPPLLSPFAYRAPLFATSPLADVLLLNQASSSYPQIPVRTCCLVGVICLLLTESCHSIPLFALDPLHRFSRQSFLPSRQLRRYLGSPILSLRPVTSGSTDVLGARRADPVTPPCSNHP